nr:hypothetical protein [uncultured Dyadobacter sp.]
MNNAKNDSFVAFYMPKGSMFQAQTLFDNLALAEQFLSSDLFSKHGFRFDFLLKNGELLKGTPRENSKKYFQSALKFAIDIPLSEYLR